MKKVAKVEHFVQERCGLEVMANVLFEEVNFFEGGRTGGFKVCFIVVFEELL